MIRKSAIIRASDIADDRTATFIASDATPDRYGDTIQVDGWDVSEFKNNPQFLDGKHFKAQSLFTPEGMDDFADKCYRFLKGGFLNAVSVGFMPIKQEPIYDDDGRYMGTNFIKQSLLELSLVPIPANPNAVQVARSMNFSRDDLDLLFDHDSVKRELAASRREMELLRLRLSD
jgi:hypothetical protein